MSFIWPGQPPARTPYGYERAIVDEVSMLLDYVAGCPTQTLHNLAVTPDQGRIDLGKPTATMPVPTVLSELATIKGHLDNKPDATITSGELLFLFLVRDALNTLVKPASGLTVAYPAMVVGKAGRGRQVPSRACETGICRSPANGTLAPARPPPAARFRTAAHGHRCVGLRSGGSWQVPPA